MPRKAAATGQSAAHRSTARYGMPTASDGSTDLATGRISQEQMICWPQQTRTPSQHLQDARDARIPRRSRALRFKAAPPPSKASIAQMQGLNIDGKDFLPFIDCANPILPLLLTTSPSAAMAYPQRPTLAPHRPTSPSSAQPTAQAAPTSPPSTRRSKLPFPSGPAQSHNSTAYAAPPTHRTHGHAARICGATPPSIAGGQSV